MPCRCDPCTACNQYNCVCNDPHYKKWRNFDIEGALCDVLTLLEEKHVVAFYEVDSKVHDWWRDHEANEQDRIKKEALAKLSPRERRALGLK